MLTSSSRDLWYEERNGVGDLYSPFYNRAMSVDHCKCLRRAILKKSLSTKVLVPLGGPDFWTNGIHLAVIENAASPAEESWRNVEAMDDLLLLETITSPDHIALQGNVEAGGVFLACCCSLEQQGRSCS